MFKFLKLFSIFVLGGAVFVFGWQANNFLDWYPIMAALLVALLLLEIRWLSGLPFKTLTLWSQVISPIAFFSAAVLFFLFLSNEIWQASFWLIVSLVIVLYLYNIWLFYVRPERYQAFTLENFSWYLNLVTSFLAISSFFGFITFINLPLMVALLLVLAFSFLLFYQLWWIQKLAMKDFWFYGFLAVIIAIESFLALRFLPFSFYLLAFWWAAIWYISQRILVDIVKHKLVTKNIVRLTIIVLLVAVMLTATTRWF